MLKFLLKVSFFGFALVVIIFIPGNANFVFGYGNNSSDSPTLLGSTTDAPICGKEKPEQVVLYEPNHALLPKAPNPNDIRLNWLKANRANKYTIAFGLSSGNYIYGLPDVGDTDNFTVDHLTPGTTYYFVVRGVDECMPGDWSREWTFRPGGSIGYATNIDTNSSNITLPANITPAPTQGPIVNQPKAAPTTAQAAPPKSLLPPAKPIVLPTAAPKVGFFQGIWNSFLRLFRH